jgi:hypothetical protein
MEVNNDICDIPRRFEIARLVMASGPFSREMGLCSDDDFDRWTNLRLIPDGGEQSIATIPLDAFSSETSTAVIGMFAQWGLTQLMFGLLYVLVLGRYQSLIPLMWLFICFEWIGRLIF